jgi:thioredoxin 1
MSHFQEITENNFEQEILKTSQPVLLEFGAPWCGPCKRMEPLLEQMVSGPWAGKMRIAKLNVDECANLVTRHHVMSVPTLILFVMGKPVAQVTGLQPREKLVEKFENFLL